MELRNALLHHPRCGTHRMRVRTSKPRILQLPPRLLHYSQLANFPRLGHKVPYRKELGLVDQPALACAYLLLLQTNQSGTVRSRSLVL